MPKTDMKLLWIRDCHQQAKTIRKMLLDLADDLGDLTNQLNPEDLVKMFEESSDNVIEFEAYLNKLQDKLELLSHG